MPTATALPGDSNAASCASCAIGSRLPGLPFFDERNIDDFDVLDDRIVDGLRRSRLFLAWFSDLYPTRRACALELTAAMVACLGMEAPRLPTVVMVDLLRIARVSGSSIRSLSNIVHPWQT